MLLFLHSLTPLSVYVFQNNTFQAVLASNSTASYVFFLYDNLEWTNTDTDSVTAAEELPQVLTHIVCVVRLIFNG